MYGFRPDCKKQLYAVEMAIFTRQQYEVLEWGWIDRLIRKNYDMYRRYLSKWGIETHDSDFDGAVPCSQTTPKVKAHVKQHLEEPLWLKAMM